MQHLSVTGITYVYIGTRTRTHARALTCTYSKESILIFVLDITLFCMKKIPDNKFVAQHSISNNVQHPIFFSPNTHQCVERERKKVNAKFCVDSIHESTFEILPIDL